MVSSLMGKLCKPMKLLLLMLLALNAHGSDRSAHYSRCTTLENTLLQQIVQHPVSRAHADELQSMIGLELAEGYELAYVFDDSFQYIYFADDVDPKQPLRVIRNDWGDEIAVCRIDATVVDFIPDTVLPCWHTEPEGSDPFEVEE